MAFSAILNFIYGCPSDISLVIGIRYFKLPSYLKGLLLSITSNIFPSQYFLFKGMTTPHKVLAQRINKYIEGIFLTPKPETIAYPV